MRDDKPLDRRDESRLRAMYEAAPYPDLGADLKDLSLYLEPISHEIARRAPVRFLEVGCGTGHYVVGVAKAHPDWSCYAMDISQPSLDIARKLADKHGARIEFHKGSYLDPLPFDFKFDIVCALGTVHHTANPVAALKNIRNYLARDGFLLLHLYGQRADREKFDIKEALSILEPDLSGHDTRFRDYRALMDHRKRNWLKRLALTTPADVYGRVRAWWRNLVRRRRRVSWSPGWNEDYTQLNSPWIDHFCNPLERAYEVPEVRALLDASGFEVIHMLKQGREHPNLIPLGWRTVYDKLDAWDKWRLNELLAIGGGSFAIIARPAQS